MSQFKEYETLHCNNTWWYKASVVEGKLQFLQQQNQELRKSHTQMVESTWNNKKRCKT